MDQTIVIGVGGTGLQVIRAMRRQLIENDISLDLDDLPNLRFLYLDTTQADIVDTQDNRDRWEVMGKSIMLRPSEYLIFQMDDLGRIIDDIDAYPHIRAWLPVEQLRGKISAADKGTPAAQQIRALGRLAFAVNQKQIESAFRNAVMSLKSPPGSRLRIHIVSSLSGGTGSGMFLDLAYSVSEWADTDAIRIGYLVLPSLDVDRGPRYVPNAYAALMELNYFNLETLPPSAERLRSRGEGGRRGAARTPQKIQFRRTDGRLIAGTPFNFCYLISPKNQAKAKLSLDALPEMMAQRICLDLEESFSATAQFLTENGKTNMSFVLVDPYRDDRAFSQRFKTFGFSFIKYPAGAIAELLAYRIARELFETWTARREIPGNITERLGPLMHELRLTDDYLLGDKDIFGNAVDFAGAEEEVNKFVNASLAAVPQTNIEAALRQKPSAFETQFRSTGAIQFFQVKTHDLPGALAEVMRLTRKRISDMIVDPVLGPEFAARILEELVRALDRRRKQFVDAATGLPAKEKNTLASLDEFYRKLTEAERKLVFKEKAVREALVCVGDAMKAYLRTRIAARAYAYSIALLNALLEDARGGLKALQQELHDWNLAVVRLNDALAQEVAARAAHLSSANNNPDQMNGTVVYDAGRLEDLFTTLDVRNSALPHVRDTLLERNDGIALSFRLDGESRGKGPALPTVALDAYRAALDWLLTRSTVRLREKNIADNLLDDFPDPQSRRALLLDVFQRSAPFLVFSQNERSAHQMNADVAYDFDANTYACAIALLKDESGALADVSAIRNELKNFKTENGKEPHISTTSNPNQILFLQEWSAFPLRLIADLRALRDRYHEAKGSPLPLHIQRDFTPQLGDLMITSTAERRDSEESEEALFVARALGVVREAENQRDMRDEIRYFYRHAGVDTFAVLGNDWEEALASIAGGESSEVRDRLIADARERIRKLDTGAARMAFAGSLLAHLNAVRAAAPFRDEDPEYERSLAVYQRLVSRHKLDDYADKAAAAQNVVSAEPVTPPVRKWGFEDEVKLAITNYPAGLPEQERDALAEEARRFGIAAAEALAIIDRSGANGGETEAQRSYGALFKRYFGDGFISDMERERLRERQRELGLSADEVRSIEQRFTTSRTAV